MKIILRKHIIVYHFPFKLFLQIHITRSDQMKQNKFRSTYTHHCTTAHFVEYCICYVVSRSSIYIILITYSVSRKLCLTLGVYSISFKVKTGNSNVQFKFAMFHSGNWIVLKTAADTVLTKACWQERLSEWVSLSCYNHASSPLWTKICEHAMLHAGPCNAVSDNIHAKSYFCWILLAAHISKFST